MLSLAVTVKSWIISFLVWSMIVLNASVVSMDRSIGRLTVEALADGYVEKRGWGQDMAVYFKLCFECKRRLISWQR